MGSIHGCAPRRGYISERGWNSPARVYVRPWGKNTSVRRDGNQFPKVVVIRPHVCARPCGKNTSVRRDGNQLPNAVGICPHVCVRPWRGWNSTARVCATAGSTYECALRWDIFPNVLGICPHVCMRPWEVYTSVRRDGNQFPNVVGIRPHVCARPWGKTQVCAETGIDFQTWLEFAHTRVCDLGKYTRVCTDTGIDSQQSMRLLVWLRVVHEHSVRRARRNLKNQKQQKTRGARQSSERGGNVRACVLLTLGNIHGCVPRWAFIPRSPLSYRCGWENKEKTRDFEQKM